MSESISVYLFEGYEVDKDLLQEHINEINNLQSSFFIDLHQDNTLQLNPTEEIQSWEHLTSTVKNTDNNSNYKIGILSAPIENNWFSVVDHNLNISFITTDNWNNISEISVYAYLLYEIFQNYQEMRLGKMIPHDETKGCMNDMCGYKLDINFKIRSGWVCQDCLLIWNDAFTKREIEDINIILDAIRMLALNRKHAWQISNKYPAPIAIRYRLMQAEGNSYIKFQKLIDLYDAIIRYTAFNILAIMPSEESIPRSLITLRKRVLEGNPTLATWESVIGSFCDVNSDRFNFLNEQDLKAIQTIKSICFSGGIRESRNDYTGHNYAGQDLKEHLDLYLDKIKIVQSMLSECNSSLFRFTLAKIDDIAFEQGQPGFSYRRLCGDSMIFDTNNMTFNTIPYDNKHLILIDEENRKFISVHPYIVYAVCEECNHERILFRDGAFNDGTARYIDTLIGHRTKCV